MDRLAAHDMRLHARAYSHRTPRPWARRRRAATSSSDGHSTSASCRRRDGATAHGCPCRRGAHAAQPTPCLWGTSTSSFIMTQLWPGSWLTPTATGAPSAAACTAQVIAMRTSSQAGASRLDERRTVRLGSHERRRALREERELYRTSSVFSEFFGGLRAATSEIFE